LRIEKKQDGGGSQEELRAGKSTVIRRKTFATKKAADAFKTHPGKAGHGYLPPLRLKCLD